MSRACLYLKWLQQEQVVFRTQPPQPATYAALHLPCHALLWRLLTRSAPCVFCSYAVAGYTEHMDERGEVKEPPPFDKVAMDWGEIGAQHCFSLLRAALG